MADTLPPVPLPKLVAQLAVMFVIAAAILFVPAGTLNWPHAWWFIAISIAAMIAAVVYVIHVNPEIVAARQNAFGEGTKSWDLIIVVLVLGGIVAICPLAGLEFRISGVGLPVSAVIAGYLLYLAGLTIMTWAQGENRHFEPSVRIQSDRDHTVIQTGPYATIRHPGYISASMFVLGMALALGSAWALVPAIFTIVVLVIRTVLEDRMLREELPGYAQYAARVRYRWLPGIW